MTADGVGRLLSLSVVDLALIERLRLELEPGLNVITGETGAGKSLLIDALGLVLGARADATLVRHGAATARVEALFDRIPEALIAVREVGSAGRSGARLDDEAVTAARLAEATGALVEIHGQHDQQRLLDERRQRDLLDAYGGCGPARSDVAAAVERWRRNRAALADLSIEPREIARRLELAEHEVAEITAARLRVGEADELRARLAAAQHGETIARLGAALRDELAGEGGSAEGTGGAREALGRAMHHARDLARIDGRFEAVSERLAAAEAEVEDLGSEARRLLDDVDHDPADLARNEERLSRIFTLERRYGEDEAAVLAHAERMAGEAVRLRGVEREAERRRRDDAALLVEVARAAATLSAMRSGAAGLLAEATSAALEGLGFGHARFTVAVGQRVAGADEPAVELGGDALAFDATGVDQVVFRFAPNPGEPDRPLARIASGGELSRVALAIEAVLAAADETPTLVFDEIDAGIGGRSADPVGRSLWLLGRRHQVLCVTHLPQIAAHADAHFRISKHERNGRTITEVARLDDAERAAEIALMLGGPGGGEASLAGARDLLRRAAAWRRSLAADGDPAVVA